MDFASVEAERSQRSMTRPTHPGDAACSSNPYAVRRGKASPGRFIGIFTIIDSRRANRPGGDSSIRAEELPYAVGSSKHAVSDRDR